MIKNFSITKEITGTGTYADADCVGGLVEIDLPVSTGQLHSVNIATASADVVSGSFWVYVFDSNPTASTITDNAAIVMNDADIIKGVTLFQNNANVAVDPSENCTKYLLASSGHLYTQPFSTTNSTLYIAIVNMDGGDIILTENLQIKLVFTE